MQVANDCLRWCEPPVLVLSTTLNNTLSPDWGFEDMAGGLVPTASFDDSISFNDNSRIKVSTGKARNAGASQVVLKGVQYRRSLSDPFSGGSSSTLSKMFINHLDGADQLHFRNWSQSSYVLKVGGKFKPNTAYADILKYSEYPTWIQGRILGKDFDEKSMGVFFNSEPRQLSNLFPLNRFYGGAADGKTIPFVIGHVRAMSPVVKSGSRGQFHDGDCEGIVSAYDLDGNQLTLEAGDPSLDTVSAVDKYMADNLGFVAWHSDINGVVLEVKGARIGGVYSDKANELIEEMVRIATGGTVPVNYSFDGKQVGWVFYDQRPIKEQVNLILDGIDCFYSEVEDDNSITIRRRYNARFNDLDGVANNRDSFELGEVDGFNKGLKQIKETPRPKRVTLLFNQNFSPLSRDGLASATRDNLSTQWEIKTNPVFEGLGDERVIECAYTQSADADELARMVSDRYGIKSFVYTWTEPVIGLGIIEGDVGTNRHRLIAPNLYTEIRSITVDTNTKKTNIQAVIYG